MNSNSAASERSSVERVIPNPTISLLGIMALLSMLATPVIMGGIPYVHAWLSESMYLVEYGLDSIVWAALLIAIAVSVTAYLLLQRNREYLSTLFLGLIFGVGPAIMLWMPFKFANGDIAIALILLGMITASFIYVYRPEHIVVFGLALFLSTTAIAGVNFTMVFTFIAVILGAATGITLEVIAQGSFRVLGYIRNLAFKNTV